MPKSTNKKMLRGAAIIGVAGVIVKILGAFFRVPLTNWLGATGMSYYSFAYSIYGSLVVLATAGIPVAISRMVSENISQKKYKNAHRTFVVSTRIMTILGLVLFLICYFGAGIITRILGNPDAATAVRSVAPALLFVPILSSFRGYFQGRQNMNPTALSEIMEQFVRIIVGLSLAKLFLADSEVKAAGGAAFGATIGSFAALILIVFIYMLNRPVFKKKMEMHDPSVEPDKDIAKKIILIAIPIIIGSEIMPIMNLADTAIIMKRLQATGFSLDDSKRLYGLISSYCSTLIGFPQIFTQAVAISLVPAISNGFAVHDIEDVKSNTSLGYRLTMLLAFPCAFGIFFLAEPILLLLYPSNPGEVAEAVPTLMIMSVGVIGLAISQTSTGVLQAIGKQNLPVKHLAIGMVVKIILTYILVGIKVLNIKGAAISTLAAYIISFVLNNISVRKYTEVKFDYLRTYILPCIASAVMGVACFGLYRVLINHMGNTIATGLSVIAGVVIYAIMSLILKTVNAEELSFLPGGDKLNKVISKVIKNWN